jgi:hypothetical protein
MSEARGLEAERGLGSIIMTPPARGSMDPKGATPAAARGEMPANARGDVAEGLDMSQASCRAERRKERRSKEVSGGCGGVR